jgi:hypothetical protein
MALALALVAGCGTNTTPDTTAPYVGTWQIASGAETIDCGRGPGAPQAVTGSVIINDAPSHNTLSVRDTNHGSCVWTLDAGETLATFKAGDPCTTMTPTEVSQVVITPMDYTLTVPSGSTATVTSTFVFAAAGMMCRHVTTETLAR